MRYELFIGLRYLRAKRKEAFVSLLTVMSMAGVMIGVMTLNIALSVMTGLEEDLRDRILGFNPHVVVLTYGSSISDYPTVIERVLSVPSVEVAEPFVYGQAMLSTSQTVSGVVLRGVLPSRGGTVDIESYLKEGSVEDLSRLHQVQRDPGLVGTVSLPGIIVGKELSRQLGLGVGDPVSVLSPMSTPSAIGFVPKVKRFVVVGVFDSGMSEYDATLAYVGLAEAQRFFGLDGGVTGIEARVRDLYHAREVAREIGALLGFPYRVRDWIEANHNLWAALRLEKTVYFIVLLLIILVAAFNIVATLIMVVMEKRKDIAILKSMGAPAAAVARIFVLKGVIIGVVGTLLGNLTGYAACWALRRYEFIELPPDVFYVSTLPIKMYPQYFAAVTLASLVICFLATLYPARQAARLVPVDVIRYE
jgi:lipoprotein-releasing system permease protein